MRFATSIVKAITLASFGRSIVASDSNNTQSRRLQTDDCVLYVKIVAYDDGSESQEIDCYDKTYNTFSKITTARGSDYIQGELLKRFEDGHLVSGESTLVHKGAYFVGGEVLVLPSMKDAKFGRKSNRKLRSRRLVSGARTYMPVRITATDSSTSSSAATISNKWFGNGADALNYKSQIEACSYGAVNVQKYAGSGVVNGVADITVSTSVIGRDDSVVVNAATAVLGTLGLRNGPDHVILCIPPGTAGGWIGYAYINSDLSVYNNEWCNYPSIQMHEIGHNWGLAHSSEGGEYGDQTGLMGFSYSQDDGPAMCFNAAKNRQLGWYSNRQVTVTSNWSGKIYGIPSYLSSSSSDAVIIYIPANTNGSTEDYYVSFNQATGFNSGTVEKRNRVVVHRRSPGTGYALSYLVFDLGSGQSYYGAPLSITVTSILTNYAEVIIGSGPNPTPPSPSPPTGSPPSPSPPTASPPSPECARLYSAPSTSTPVFSPTFSSPVNVPSTSFPQGSPVNAPFSTSFPQGSPVNAPTTYFPQGSPVNAPTTSFPQGSPFNAPFSTSFPQGSPVNAPSTSFPQGSPVNTPTTSFPQGSPVNVPFSTSFPQGSPVNAPSTSFPQGSPVNAPTTSFPVPSRCPSVAPVVVPTRPVSDPITSAPFTSPVSSPVFVPPVATPSTSPVSSPVFVPPVATPSTSPVSSPVFVPPVATPTIPTSKPVQTPSVLFDDPLCIDAPLEWLLTKKKGMRTCEWVASNPAVRCKKQKVKSLCPITCSSEELCSSDAIGRFQYGSNLKNCGFVRRVPSKVQTRCAKPGVENICRATCNNAGKE